MTAVFYQVLVLFAFAALGFLLSKRKMLNTQHTPILSVFLVNIFLPFNVFRTFCLNFNREYICANYALMLWSVAIILPLTVLMTFISKFFAKRKYEQSIYEYSLIIPNYGYMGYPMAEAVLGPIGLLNAMMFGFSISFYTYTVGYCKLSKRDICVKKLINPILIAMLFGALAGLFRIKMPVVVISVLEKASACMGPVSMLLAGVVISEFDLKELFSMKKVYIVTALRLIVIPVIIGLLLRPLSRIAMETALLIYAMPCGLNTIVFPRLVGEDCRIGAGLALVSNILACVTIPLVLALFSIGG